MDVFIREREVRQITLGTIRGFRSEKGWKLQVNIEDETKNSITKAELADLLEEIAKMGFAEAEILRKQVSKGKA